MKKSVRVYLRREEPLQPSASYLPKQRETKLKSTKHWAFRRLDLPLEAFAAFC